MDRLVEHHQQALFFASGEIAVRTALLQLNGPSRLIAVNGRIAPTTTTGFSTSTVSCGICRLFQAAPCRA